MNRVQFQKGLSMPEFLDRYGTEVQCEQALIAARWPSGFVCPSCGVTQARTTFRRQGRLYYQCAGCQHQCSVTSGTVFGSTKLPLTRWFLAMQFLTQSKNNVAALELKRQIGVCYRTAWLVKHKLLEAMRLIEADRQLTGRVEIDDAYLGGQRGGGKTGRGSENKVPFVAAVQTTEDGRPHLACLSPRPFTKQALEDFFAQSTVLPLTVVSDGLGCFEVAASLGAYHDRTVTGAGKASVELEQFRCVNTLISNIKTALSGTYHAVKFAKYRGRTGEHCTCVPRTGGTVFGAPSNHAGVKPYLIVALRGTQVDCGNVLHGPARRRQQTQIAMRQKGGVRLQPPRRYRREVGVVVHRHLVRQGEHIHRIAKDEGFHHWDTVWQAAENGDLRQLRSNPNVLLPGDVLVIPTLQSRQETRPTDACHTFVLKRAPLKLRIALHAPSDRPLSGHPCTLAIDRQSDPVDPVTDSQGVLEIPLVSDAEFGTLHDHGSTSVSGIRFERIFDVRIGHLDPVSEVSGQVARLDNLGYDAAEMPDHDLTPEETSALQASMQFLSAVEEFQCDHDLMVDGRCGPETQQALLDAHGS